MRHLRNADCQIVLMLYMLQRPSAVTLRNSPRRDGMNLSLLGSISELGELPSGDAISPLKACTEFLIGR